MSGRTPVVTTAARVKGPCGWSSPRSSCPRPEPGLETVGAQGAPRGPTASPGAAAFCAAFVLALPGALFRERCGSGRRRRRKPLRVPPGEHDSAQRGKGSSKTKFRAAVPPPPVRPLKGALQEAWLRVAPPPPSWPGAQGWRPRRSVRMLVLTIGAQGSLAHFCVRKPAQHCPGAASTGTGARPPPSQGPWLLRTRPGGRMSWD